MHILSLQIMDYCKIEKVFLESVIRMVSLHRYSQREIYKNRKFKKEIKLFCDCELV